MAVEIANSGKPIRFYTIDHWRGSAAEFRHNADADVRQGRLYDVFLENIRPVAAFVNVIRDDSSAAAERFDDGSVDFLYVDASHEYDGVLRDLAAWFPKVKEGGVIAGDDWCFADRQGYGVRDAVLDYFGPSAARLVIEPGSPNSEWLQWSIRKESGLAVSSAAELKAARLRRTLRRAATAAAVRYGIGSAIRTTAARLNQAARIVRSASSSRS